VLCYNNFLAVHHLLLPLAAFLHPHLEVPHHHHHQAISRRHRPLQETKPNVSIY